MKGLLLVVLVCAWLQILRLSVTRLSAFFPTGRWRRFVQLGLFLILLPLPLIDEIVGGWQFSKLCESNDVFVRKASSGRKVHLESSADMPIAGTWVNVSRIRFRYLDVESGDVIVEFYQLHAKAGKLVPGFDSGDEPILFHGECHPRGVFERNFFDHLGLTVVN